MKFFQIFLIIAEIELVATSPSTLRPRILRKRTSEGLCILKNLCKSPRSCLLNLHVQKGPRAIKQKPYVWVSNSYLDCVDQPCAKKSLDESHKSLGGKKPKEHIPYKFFYLLTDQIFLFSKTTRLNILHIFTKSN